MKFHPNDVVLQEFYFSHGDEHQALLAHVVRCPKCLLRLGGLVERPLEGSIGDREEACDLSTAYHEVLEQAETFIAGRERALTKERASAPGLFVELMKLSDDQKRLLIRNSHRFRTWGLCELLLERCRETVIQDPMGAEGLATLALEVAAKLDATYYRNHLVQDLHARAWGYLGNARRVRSDFGGAEEAFVQAASHLKKGSRDLVDFAILLDLKASLRRAQRRFDEALKLLRRAVALFRRAGHFHRAGRSLIIMNTVHRYAGHPERGIPLLCDAIKLIDSDRDPRLDLCARHNLIDDLADTGRFLEAQKHYRETRSYYRSFPDVVTQSRRKWVKGKISSGLGQTAQAERLFLAARDGFIAESMGYDTALISLELATLYARQGRTADLKRLAQEMLPIFSSLQIHREALAALSFLQKALKTERASVELVCRVAEFLRRAEHDPGLRFEP